MRPITIYSPGEVMRDCIFIQEIDSVTLQYKGINKTKFVKRRALFKCSCGKEFEAAITHIRNGNIKSCGCLRDVKIKQQGHRNKIHGLRKHPLCSIWYSMIRRCQEPSDMNYFRYGARGISVCERWQNITNFVNDMKDSYSRGLQLDRICNDGNYSLENCRWVTRKVNANNTRRNRFVEYNGIRKTVGEWSTYTGIPYATLINRLNSWDINKVFNTPYTNRNIKKL